MSVQVRPLRRRGLAAAIQRVQRRHRAGERDRRPERHPAPPAPPLSTVDEVDARRPGSSWSSSADVAAVGDRREPDRLFETLMTSMPGRRLVAEEVTRERLQPIARIRTDRDGRAPERLTGLQADERADDLGARLTIDPDERDRLRPDVSRPHRRIFALDFSRAAAWRIEIRSTCPYGSLGRASHRSRRPLLARGDPPVACVTGSRSRSPRPGSRPAAPRASGCRYRGTSRRRTPPPRDLDRELAAAMGDEILARSSNHRAAVGRTVRET